MIPAVLVLLALSCGGGDAATGEEAFSETKPSESGKALGDREESGTGINETESLMTVIDGVKQWAGPPKGLSGGLLIVYKDEFRVTVEMETVGGQPANGKKIVFDLYHSDFPFFRHGDLTFTVNNFVFLAREGFYDGLPFHHVVPGTIIKTGDPPGPLDGAGYLFDNEPTVRIKHDRTGIVSMENKGIVDGKGTNSSQWFITMTALPHLDTYDEELYERDCTLPDISCHTPFGVVIEGMDVVESIIEGDVIKSVTVEKLENGTSKFDELTS